MRYLPILLANLRRKKVRTAFTVLSILIAFVLFGLLTAIRQAFSFGAELAGADRLITTHKTSIIISLPKSYQDQIARVPGVTLATHAGWFGGVYQNPDRRFQNLFQAPIEPAAYMKMYPEYKLPPEQMAAWLADREGAVVGRKTAENFGWKIGDRVPIQATIWSKKDGTKLWEFNLRGIYDGEQKGTDTTQFLFRYDYFDEARQFGQGTVGWYLLKIADPEKAPAIARAIDDQFANSPYETKTTTEKALIQGWADQVGDIGAIITAIVSVVFFILLLVAGNTMAQAVRERTSELAVLKTLGFTNRKVMGMVLAESLLLAVLGGGLGLLLAWPIVTVVGGLLSTMLPIFYLPAKGVAMGVALILVLGLVTGFLPGLQAMRLRIVDALRRV
ncbi:MAG TPA: FtsX-like permease family protein [Thermoanaerobaculia bacterium]|nr:FtsX-like permease family protein [Thermoanaerobaculia bacterium]